MTTEPKMPPLPEPPHQFDILFGTGKAVRVDVAMTWAASRDQQWAERVAELECVELALKEALAVACLERDALERVLGVAREKIAEAHDDSLDEKHGAARTTLLEAIATIDAARSKEKQQ